MGLAYLVGLLQDGEDWRGDTEQDFHGLPLSSSIFPALDRSGPIGFLADRFAVSDEIQIDVVAIRAAGTSTAVPNVPCNTTKTKGNLIGLSVSEETSKTTQKYYSSEQLILI